MTKRPGDKTVEPPGGRAAERLRMFEEARQSEELPTGKKKRKSEKDSKRNRLPKRDDS
jgi:hypothetical protein